uniref:Molybdenum cofactor synthesis 2 n=1 Tax=Ovis aries TaxID=9940 RepID=A0AC11DMX4_SHEEP
MTATALPHQRDTPASEHQTPGPRGANKARKTAGRSQLCACSVGAEGAGRLGRQVAPARCATWCLRFRGRNTRRDFPGGMVPRCQVEVLYFAKSAEIAGIRSETISVPQEIKALQLWNEIEARHPGKDMNEVEEKSKDIIKFTSEKLSVDEVSQLVISPLCGAISLFVGTTRNNFEGKKVISLEYEAYLPMAENEIRKICSDIRQKWPVKHIAVFHRLGLVPVTEASVIIAVSSAHRAASLEAVSYAIDALKARVPIWKKEIYEESSSSWKRNKECFWATSV